MSLVVSLGLAAIAYPFAAIPAAEAATARAPLPAEEMEDVDLGDFGVVSVLELVGYYIENPPASEVGAAGGKKKRFQGC
jgi:hypothetical protein